MFFFSNLLTLPDTFLDGLGKIPISHCILPLKSDYNMPPKRKDQVTQSGQDTQYHLFYPICIFFFVLPLSQDGRLRLDSFPKQFTTLG
jgi:hypothetical protein